MSTTKPHRSGKVTSSFRHYQSPIDLLQPAKDARIWRLVFDGQLTWLRFDDAILFYASVGSGFDPTRPKTRTWPHSIALAAINKLTLEPAFCSVTIHLFTGARHRLVCTSRRELEFFKIKLIACRPVARQVDIRGMLIFMLTSRRRQKVIIGGRARWWQTAGRRSRLPSSKCCRETLEEEIGRRCQIISDSSEPDEDGLFGLNESSPTPAPAEPPTSSHSPLSSFIRKLFSRRRGTFKLKSVNPPNSPVTLLSFRPIDAW